MRTQYTICTLVGVPFIVNHFHLASVAQMEPRKILVYDGAAIPYPVAPHPGYVLLIEGTL